MDAPPEDVVTRTELVDVGAALHNGTLPHNGTLEGAGSHRGCITEGPVTD